ncbi:hypothetical protein, partial [Megasphaera elsdenii]|uniref:hypothetical protein n=1 Tax=Megasphaera elsdenii TaxID=907 RepID=UPI0039EA391E
APSFSLQANFNPRTREGCDEDDEDADCRHDDISIHAPVKGATDGLAGTVDDFRISIHAPVKGATSGRSCKTPSCC